MGNDKQLRFLSLWAINDRLELQALRESTAYTPVYVFFLLLFVYAGFRMLWRIA